MAKQRSKAKPKLKSLHYADQRLAELGLGDKELKCNVKIIGIDAYERPVERGEVEIRRISGGTFGKKWEFSEGPDIFFQYIGLDYTAMTYMAKNAKKEKNLYRVRYSNPDAHRDRFGKAMKYQSPPQSGIALWIPETIRRAYHNGKQFNDLHIVEGELKAEKAAKHGMMIVGVMGIQNIGSGGSLPKEFEMLIRQCGIKRINFIVDNDAFELSDDLADSQKPANGRPHNFYVAVNTFRDYFSSFATIGIFLELFFSPMQPNLEGEKGIDDLMVGTLKKQEHLFECELLNLMGGKGDKGEGGVPFLTGKYAKCYHITETTKTQMKAIFCLQDAETFARRYRDELIPLERFFFWKVCWKIDENGFIKLAQPILPEEQFWQIISSEGSGSSKEKIVFDHMRARQFLTNKSFGRYRIGKKFSWVKADSNVVTEIEDFEIGDYMINFVETINQPKVLQLLLKGGDAYIGQKLINRLPFLDCNFHKAAKEVQYMYFRNCFLEISANGIKVRQLSELGGMVWADQIIDRDFSLESEPLMKLVDDPKRDDWDIVFSDKAKNCDALQFMSLTSLFHWRKAQEDENYLPSQEENDEHRFSFMSKVTAMGYLLHDFRNPARAKAVIAMDVRNSENGQSFGRTGKGIYAEFINHTVNTVTIPAKDPKLLEDKFLLEEVSEKTKVLNFDDCNRKLDFEFFFPMITGSMVVNKKGLGKVTLKKDISRKFFFSTNFSFAGSSDSFRDRQILLGFSDFFSAKRKPSDYYGYLLFDDWDEEQWNLFYNCQALCLVIYFQKGIIKAPTERLELRRLRQEIGEDFLNWAELFFQDSVNINRPFDRKDINRKVEEEVKYANRWTSAAIKGKMKSACQYFGLHFNPSRKDQEGREFDSAEIKASGRIHVGGNDKRSGTEWFVFGNNDWTLSHQKKMES